ncbi:hypothetical protein TIFTF001_026176 [Ficus carica]|uniref:Uncharacterized protein n=1 Tax=Ficus carica TaxID=3494 RepID=A0AA88DKQ9_FICCA|nr:hypothetical protein TIFTF001_026176 [Ficus carica]
MQSLKLKLESYVIFSIDQELELSCNLSDNGNPRFHGERVVRARVGPFSRSVEKSWWPCTSDQTRLISRRFSPGNWVERPPSPLYHYSPLWTTSGSLAGPVALARAALPLPRLNPAFTVGLALPAPCHSIPTDNSTLAQHTTPAA